MPSSGKDPTKRFWNSSVLRYFYSGAFLELSIIELQTNSFVVPLHSNTHLHHILHLRSLSLDRTFSMKRRSRLKNRSGTICGLVSCSCSFVEGLSLCQALRFKVMPLHTSRTVLVFTTAQMISVWTPTRMSLKMMVWLVLTEARILLFVFVIASASVMSYAYVWLARLFPIVRKRKTWFSSSFANLIKPFIWVTGILNIIYGFVLAIYMFTRYAIGLPNTPLANISQEELGWRSCFPALCCLHRYLSNSSACNAFANVTQ